MVNPAMQAQNNDHSASFFEEAFFNSTQTYIHPTSFVGPNVKLGSNVKIGPYSTVTGHVEIHDNTRIYSHVAIGLPAQDAGTRSPLGKIIIGKDCEIRTFVTIGASKIIDGTTTIGNNCYIMNYCHIAHDSTLEDNVILINSVNLGGHTYIEKNAILMANAGTHQFCRIGQYSSLAPYSGIRQDLPPFSMFSGQPARFAGLNLVGLKRAQFTPGSLRALKQVTKLFFQDKLLLDQIINHDNMKTIWKDEPAVHTFIEFIKNSHRGVSRKNLTDRNSQFTTL